MENASPTTSIALLSTPWPLFNRPSIQLGTLKAYLRKNAPEIRVDAYPLYLRVAEALGYDLYKAISERSWLSEACYAALLYPEREQTVARFWNRHARDIRPKPEFQNLCAALQKASDRLLSSVHWTTYPLIGLSMCCGQLTSSLYFIRRIKQASPRSALVVGGSSCAGRMGQSLLRAFPEIDFAVSGEGETPLLHLVKRLFPSCKEPDPAPIPGLLCRGSESSFGFAQVPSLDALPVPDYSDYFRSLRTLPEAKRFLPKIPVEMSRGCWWRKKDLSGQDRGCAFCNLNLQWEGYRSKSQGKILEEISSLSDRHELLSFSFMDNLLPSGNLKSLFEEIAKMKKDFRFFAEIRATVRLDELLAMAAAGMAEVQVGIEALSARLLKKLNKGTTVIQNLEIMKNCEARDTPDLTSNLITHFPTSDETDVGETLRTLEFARFFRPLKAAPFWLGYESPVWRHPEAFGIRKVRSHPFYANLFPPEVLTVLRLILQGYEGGRRAQQRLWRPVTRAVDSWRKSYTRLHSASGNEPLLSYEDGRAFLIIRERGPASGEMAHRLRGSSRQIYLFCETSRFLPEIVARFPAFGQEKILPFLTMMVDKRLMFREGDRFLSLAVPARGFAEKYEIPNQRLQG